MHGFPLQSTRRASPLPEIPLSVYLGYRPSAEQQRSWYARAPASSCVRPERVLGSGEVGTRAGRCGSWGELLAAAVLQRRQPADEGVIRFIQAERDHFFDLERVF